MGRIIILGLSFMFSLMAYGQNCNFQFDQNQINVNYNGNSLTTFFFITVYRPNNSSSSSVCDRVAFFFGRGYANSYQRKVYKNGDTIGYTLENISPTGTLKTYDDHSGQGEFLSTYIDKNQTKILTGLFKMPAQNMPGGAGHYQDVVNVTVYGYQNENSVSQGMTKQLVINVQTQASMNLSIVPEGANYNGSSTSATLDFGTLTQNEELGADLIVKSNIGYRVRVGSNQNGNLKHSNQNVYIPYQFRFAGSIVNLNGTNGNPTSVVTVPGGSAASGDRYNMRIRIGNPQGKPFGNYSDFITVSIQSN